MLFLGGDLDAAGRPVPDFVALRYNRFLQRYELTSLVWDVANQEFVQRAEDVAAVVTAEGDAAVGGKLTRDARFTLVLDGGAQLEVTTRRPSEAGLGWAKLPVTWWICSRVRYGASACQSRFPVWRSMPIVSRVRPSTAVR